MAGDRPRDASRMQNAQPASRRTPSPWPQGTRRLCVILRCPSALRLGMVPGRIPHTLAFAPDLIPARTRSGDRPSRGKISFCGRNIVETLPMPGTGAPGPDDRPSARSPPTQTPALVRQDRHL